MRFSGYVRPQGGVGVRNFAAVIYTVECARVVANRIAEGYACAQVFGFPGCYANNLAFERLISLATHSNVTGVIIVSLGCECTDFRHLVRRVENRGQRVESVVIQQDGGTLGTIERGRRVLEELLEGIDAISREEVSTKDLTVGLVLDAKSKDSEAIGDAVDQMIGEGCKLVSPVHTLLGVEEQELRAHVRDDSARAQIASALDKVARVTKQFHETPERLGSHEGVPPAYGNVTVHGLLPPNQAPEHPGFYLVDSGSTPNEPILSHFEENLADSFLHLAACGAQVILQGTGTGSIEGSVVVPVLKVCTDRDEYRLMPDDFDLGLDASGIEIHDCLTQVASGKMIAAEELGHYEYYVGYKH